MKASHLLITKYLLCSLVKCYCSLRALCLGFSVAIHP